MSREKLVDGFDYITGQAVSRTASEWRAAYPAARFRRTVENGETSYHAPRHMEHGAWVESRIVAEAYGNVAA